MSTLQRTHLDLFDDREFRDSLHLIERQRSTRRVLAVAALIGALFVAFMSVYLMYSDQLPSAPPAQMMH